jgi:beta-glucosidase
MKKIPSLILTVILFTQLAAQQNVDVENLLSGLTLNEKIELLGGTGFDSKPIERLGIPSIKMADGPLGIRWETATAFPATIALGASWDKELAYKVGKAIAKEVRAKGRDMLLGPCVNLVRTPHGGRNFESYGEDPALSAQLSVNYIKGVQSEDVMACIKHFAVNNQEYKRLTIDAVVDERTLREIYLPAFKLGVQEGKVASVMSAYNVLNGTYCSENDFLLNTILKDEWKFDGFVVSDWGAVHSTLGTAKFGVDIEMPKGSYLNESLIELIGNGEVDEKIIDDKVRRLLQTSKRFGLFGDRTYISEGNPYDINRKLAYEAAASSIVLLKNSNSILPLDIGRVKSIAVLGPNAAVNRAGGGGSSRVNFAYSVSPLEAFKNKIGSSVIINYAPGVKVKNELNVLPSKYLKTIKDGNVINGLTGYYYNNKNLEGEPVLIRVDDKIDFDWGGGKPNEALGDDNYSIRWEGILEPDESGEYELGLVSDDGVRLFVNGEKVIDDWVDRAASYSGYAMQLVEGTEYKIEIEYYENGGSASVGFGWLKVEGNLMDEAKTAALNSDVIIVFAGTSEHLESEGYDRPSLTLPDDQLKLLSALDKLGKEYILVLNNGGQLVMPKVYEKAAAVVEAWFPGQEGGNAIVDILTGDENPSGKLPYSIPKRWEDCSSYNLYPEENDKIYYKDGLYIGYRHFDKNNIELQYNFGYGLSYTQFNIDSITLSKNLLAAGADELSVTCRVTNIGNKAGTEVVQLYTAYESPKVDRPLKELKKFSKVYLKPGQSDVVEFVLRPEDVAYYSVKERAWTVDEGDYYILVGNSSINENLSKHKFIITK